MDYVEKLKKQNVKFETINETEAQTIIKNKYSYYKLISYADIFDKYRNGEKIGLFVKLEFAQLYYLAEIDYHVQYVLMSMFLRIEEALKTRLIYDVENLSVPETFMDEYCDFDKEYLEKAYVSTNNDAMKNFDENQSITNLKLDEFMDVIQFGTLQRVAVYFYEKHAYNIYDIETLKIRLESVRRIRNIIAHNNSVINKLTIATDYKDLKTLSYLGRSGIKKRTLQTNMSKMIISDLCGFFDMYFMLNSCNDIQSQVDALYCTIQRYKPMFFDNDKLVTSYKFLKRVYVLYRDKYKK